VGLCVQGSDALKQLNNSDRARTAAKLKIISVLPKGHKGKERSPEHPSLSKVSMDDDR
jgi:hypothetical protein